jgi:hypothetical protein
MCMHMYACAQVPKTVIVKVSETEPGAKGNTAGGRVEKPAKLETGAMFNVPIFLDVGEEIKVDTEEGKYATALLAKYSPLVFTPGSFLLACTGTSAASARVSSGTSK